MLCLGIDTSNYTTSVSITENGRILADKRIVLNVKEGDKGLRQQDALYMHYSNLPLLFDEIFNEFSGREIKKIIVSTKPRPQEGSYMPVFNAGYTAAKILSAALYAPLFEVSHQEGHILAAAYKTHIKLREDFVCAHLSGGTLEFVKVSKGKFDIICETKDISFGQLIDRIGVALGGKFPAGKYVDSLALESELNGQKGIKNPICKVKISEGKVNLSGLENQLNKAISELKPRDVAYFLMDRIALALDELCNYAKQVSGCNQLLLMGGVASSQFLRNRLGEKIQFGNPDLCSDNACGLALSEGVMPWE